MKTRKALSMALNLFTAVCAPAIWAGIHFGAARTFTVLSNLLMALAALILWLTGRSRKKPEALSTEPAHIRALRKLDQFRGNKFWKPEQQKTFYSGVTDALREYIASRYDVGAMEMTTAEIFSDLRESDIPEALYQEMKTLFETADFVKFAKLTVSDEENAKVLPQAIHFVTATYEQEIAGQAGDDDKQAGQDDKKEE